MKADTGLLKFTKGKSEYRGMSDSAHDLEKLRFQNTINIYRITLWLCGMYITIIPYPKALAYKPTFLSYLGTDGAVTLTKVRLHLSNGA